MVVDPAVPGVNKADSPSLLGVTVPWAEVPLDQVTTPPTKGEGSWREKVASEPSPFSCGTVIVTDMYVPLLK